VVDSETTAALVEAPGEPDLREISPVV